LKKADKREFFGCAETAAVDGIIGMMPGVKY
jgi:hypothetical protein